MSNLDFRVIRMNSGESFLCIVESETEDTINVLFPLVIKTQTIPIAKNILREIHSTTNFCPFTDDKHFSFYKPELTYIKPMGEQAITYYIDMLNRHEEADTIKAYDLSELIQEEQSSLEEEISNKIDNLLEKMNEIEDETDTSDVSIHNQNKTLH